jgi:hypothetical protein
MPKRAEKWDMRVMREGKRSIPMREEKRLIPMREEKRLIPMREEKRSMRERDEQESGIPGEWIVVLVGAGSEGWSWPSS